jgi:hypothetical protein
MNKRDINLEKMANLKAKIAVAFMLVYVLFFFVRGAITNDQLVNTTQKTIFLILGTYCITTFSYFTYRVFTVSDKVYIDTNYRSQSKLNYFGQLTILFSFAFSALLFCLYTLTPLFHPMDINTNMFIFNAMYLVIIFIGEFFLQRGLSECHHIYDFDYERLNGSQILCMHVLFLTIWWIMMIFFNPFGSLNPDFYDPESMKLSISCFLVLLSPMAAIDGYIRVYIDEQRFMEDKKAIKELKEDAKKEKKAA